MLASPWHWFPDIVFRHIAKQRVTLRPCVPCEDRDE
jgi:hypothetical protein